MTTMNKRTNAMFIEGGYASLALDDGEILTTCRLHHDRYVRIDDGRQYPQLCAYGRRRGATLIYLTDEGLARDCGARLYKTKAGFDRAVDRLRECDQCAVCQHRDDGRGRCIDWE
jgi:hypothetical protein